MEALSPEDGQLLPFTRDRHYAMHGEIWMIVLVISFAVFLLFLVLLPCLKRRYTHQSELSENASSWSGRVKSSPPVVSKQTIDLEIATGQTTNKHVLSL